MTPALVLVGALSAYHPGDGHNRGVLACGGRFTWEQKHIAIRQWRRVGCGARARVCLLGSRREKAVDDPTAADGRFDSDQPHRCAWTTVQDSGPWGATNGRRWEVQIKLQRGWRRRAVVDLSWALWRAMGRPRFLSRVRVEVYPTGAARASQ